MLVLPDKRYLQFGDAVQRALLSAWHLFLPTGRYKHAEEVTFTPDEIEAGAPAFVKVADPDTEKHESLFVEVISSASLNRPFLFALRVGRGDGTTASGNALETFFLPSARSAIPPGTVAAIFSIPENLRKEPSMPGSAVQAPHDLSLPPEHWVVAHIHSL